LQGKQFGVFNFIWLIRNRNVPFLCLQDPPLFQGNLLRAPDFQCYVSNIFGFKKRVATYVNLSLARDFNYLYFSPTTDVLYLGLSRNDRRPVLREFEKYFLINTYKRQVDYNNTVKAINIFTADPYSFLVVRDCNVHTLYTNSTRNMSTWSAKKGNNTLGLQDGEVLQYCNNQ